MGCDYYVFKSITFTYEFKGTVKTRISQINCLNCYYYGDEYDVDYDEKCEKQLEKHNKTTVVYDNETMPPLSLADHSLQRQLCKYYDTVMNSILHGENFDYERTDGEKFEDQDLYDNFTEEELEHYIKINKLTGQFLPFYSSSLDDDGEPLTTKDKVRIQIQSQKKKKQIAFNKLFDQKDIHILKIIEIIYSEER